MDKNRLIDNQDGAPSTRPRNLRRDVWPHFPQIENLDRPGWIEARKTKMIKDIRGSIPRD